LSKRSKIPSETKQAPPQRTRPTNQRTNERTNEGLRAMNERRPTSDELTNEDLRPNTKGKRLTTNEGRKEEYQRQTSERRRAVPTNQRRRATTDKRTKKGNKRARTLRGGDVASNPSNDTISLTRDQIPPKHNKFQGVFQALPTYPPTHLTTYQPRAPPPPP